MKIYQTWDGEDMALSDTWWPTLKEAWEGEADDGYDVHISRSELKPTREDICHALTFWPNR